MVFQGGKFRQSKNIAPVINQCIKENSIENYYEPFCGGLNVFDKIACNNMFANDIDNELITFYQFIHDGGEPLADISREDYYNIKNDLTAPLYLRGNTKYMGSFGGKPWGGYGGKDKRSNKNHYQASLSNFKKQIPIILKTNFTCLDYKQISFNSNSFIYCDPPYKNTTNYGNQSFDYNEYYDWARNISQKYFVIFSEYNMPNDFTCFKEISHKKSLKATDNSEVISDNLYYCAGLFKNWYENRR